MKYVQPYGISDPDAGYINGDPSIARQGSIPPAEAFEHPMRELVAVIENSQIAPSELDLEQVSKGIRSQRMNYCEDTGSIDTLSVALDPPITSYSIGLPLRVKVKNTNDGPTTIDAGGGRVPIRKPNGSELAAGDLPAFGLAELVFDGTVFQMINFGGAGGGPGSVFLYNIPYCVDSSATPNQVIANFSPPITSLSAGTIFMVKISNTNTTFSTINVNGLGLHSISAQGGTPNWPFLPGDMQAGDVVIFTYDGTQFWITANTNISQSVLLTVTTTTQINNLFTALGRKRIQTNGHLYIQLASGVYSPFTTYHADAGHITVLGTMLAAIPTPADFAKTGNSAAARAADSANNIAMLRTRYGTEVRFDNTLNPPAGIIHSGPGMIAIDSILITGTNVSGGAAAPYIFSVGTFQGAAMQCYNCSVWGSGGFGYSTAGEMVITNCYACACTNDGFYAGGSMTIYGGGSFGNTGNGVTAGYTGLALSHAQVGIPGAADIPGMQINFNGGSGVFAANDSQVTMRRSIITGNAFVDAFALNISFISLETLQAFGTASPALNTQGNNMSYISA